MRRNWLTVVIAVLACVVVSGVGYAVGTTSLGQKVTLSAGGLDVAYRASSTPLSVQLSDASATCAASLVSPTFSGGFYFSSKMTFSASNMGVTDICGYNGFSSGFGIGYSGDTRILAIVDLGTVEGTLTSTITNCVVDGAPQSVQDFNGVPVQCGDFVFIDAVMLGGATVSMSSPFGYGALVAALGAFGPSYPVSSAFPGEKVTFDVVIAATPVL